MAHEFTQKEAVEVALKLAERDAFLSTMISRDQEQAFLGGGGRVPTVVIRVPSTLMARVRDYGDKTSAIEMDDLHESDVKLSLGRQLYSAVGLSEAEMNLKLEDFARQVLSPQVDAVVEGVEEMVAEKLRTIAPAADVVYDPSDPLSVFTDLRKALRVRGVPQTGLKLVVGTDVYADLLSMNLLTQVDTSGSTGSLRDGNIGRLRGFDIAESTRIPQGDIIAFHRDAFTMAVRPPAVPVGIEGHTETRNGFGLRVMRDYDTRVACHRSVVGTFAGIADMPLYVHKRHFDNPAALLNPDTLKDGDSENTSLGSSEWVAVPGGAAIRVAGATEEEGE